VIRLRPLQVAVIVIAAIFVARAALRLAQPEFNILRFAVLGWPPWSMWAISVAELIGAALLFHVATFRYGVLVLATVSLLFLATYMRIGVPEAGMASAGMLVALAGVALWRRNPLAR
jgi:hypothetical protein